MRSQSSMKLDILLPLLAQLVNQDCFYFQENLENCSVSGICLEDSLSKSQRCFISTGTNIASFNILEGKCLSFLKNRHAQEITCLVYFNPRKVSGRVVFFQLITNQRGFGNIK